MRKGWKALVVAGAWLLVAGCVLAAPSEREPVCRESAAADGAAASPRLAADLAASLALARGGDAKEQRKLAVHYETGYRVARCDEKALYWYRQAAAGGDDVAKKWLARHERFAELRSQGECFDSRCGGNGADGRRLASFVVGANGHYFAPVTINGVTEMGLVDTGATTIAMSEETARRFRIDTSNGVKGQAQTAAGTISSTGTTVAQVNVGGILLRNVQVSVGVQGQMLIGMSILGRLNVRMTSGVLTLEQ